MLDSLASRFPSFFVILVLSLVFSLPGFTQTDEVLGERKARVVIRNHPKTGRPYVSIVSAETPLAPESFEEPPSLVRPDYRLLDPKVKSGEIPYAGPVTDRKKVYILAAALAGLGVAGGVAGLSVAASSAGGSASGAGAYAGGAALTGSGSAAAALKARTDDSADEFSRAAESHELDNGGGTFFSS